MNCSIQTIHPSYFCPDICLDLKCNRITELPREAAITYLMDGGKLDDKTDENQNESIHILQRQDSDSPTSELEPGISFTDNPLIYPHKSIFSQGAETILKYLLDNPQPADQQQLQQQQLQQQQQERVLELHLQLQQSLSFLLGDCHNIPPSTSRGSANAEGVGNGGGGGGGTGEVVDGGRGGGGGGEGGGTIPSASPPISTSQLECDVCFDRNKDCAFNCGHMSCSECAELLEMCHICRLKITDKRKVYL